MKAVLLILCLLISFSAAAYLPPYFPDQAQPTSLLDIPVKVYVGITMMVLLFGAFYLAIRSRTNKAVKRLLGDRSTWPQIIDHPFIWVFITVLYFYSLLSTPISHQARLVLAVIGLFFFSGIAFTKLRHGKNIILWDLLIAGFWIILSIIFIITSIQHISMQ